MVACGLLRELRAHLVDRLDQCLGPGRAERGQAPDEPDHPLQLIPRDQRGSAPDRVAHLSGRDDRAQQHDRGKRHVGMPGEHGVYAQRAFALGDDVDGLASPGVQPPHLGGDAVAQDRQRQVARRGTVRQRVTGRVEAPVGELLHERARPDVGKRPAVLAAP
jgi:hypothetical protein